MSAAWIALRAAYPAYHPARTTYLVRWHLKHRH
jgi:hypothetical protein